MERKSMAHLNIDINGQSHHVNSYGPIINSFFGRINLFGVDKKCSEIKTDSACSAIMIANDKEYYITKQPLSIQDAEGKAYDLGSLSKLIPILNNDEERIYSFLTAVDSSVNKQSKNLVVDFITLTQSCSDCLASSYCKFNCDKEWCCDWTDGCVSCLSEGQGAFNSDFCGAA
jgi:hypothetical protein